MPGPRADVLANVRDIATRQRWQILEESTTSLFAFADTGRLAVGRRKVYVSVEDSAQGVRVRLSVWGNRMGARYLVRDLLIFTWLESASAGVSRAKSGSSGTGFLDHFQGDRPVWVRLTYAGYLLLFLLWAAMFVSVVVGRSWMVGRLWLRPALLVTLFGLLLGYQVLEDVVPRFALNIKSRRGVGSSVLLSATFFVLWTMIVLVQHDILL